MGLLDVFRREGITAAAIDPERYPIASPWASGTLQRIVFEDVFGTEIPVNTRSAAMRLAPVARSRNLMVSTICRFPLIALKGPDPLPDQPTWVYRADDGTSPQIRIAWTVDDLMFYGWSAWWRTNGDDGFPLAVGRIPIEDWDFDPDGRGITVHGELQPPESVIVIPGLHEGILTFGVDVLDDARALYRNVRRRIANPVPQVDLHQTGGEDLTNTEVDELIADWAAARAGANSGVAYTNELIEVRELGAGADAQLMIEARNAAAVDLARIIGVTASRVDATADKASLNYETTTGRNQEFVEFDLALYMTPITARLSLDDVCPRGSRIGFDFTDFVSPTLSPTGPNLED